MLIPVLCIFHTFLFWSSSLWANVADSLGLGARAIALGNAYTAVADDFSAVYYNPAGLSRVPESKLTIGGIWARPYFYYQEQGGGDVRPDLYSTGALFLGVSSNLAHLTGYSQLKRWTLGVSLYVPVERALLADVPNESSDKEFIFYLDQTQVMEFLLGLSWQIHPKISIGISGNFLASLNAPNEAFVDADLCTVLPYLMGLRDLKKTVRPRIMRDAEIKAAPIVGIQAQPLPWLQCGVTYRAKFYAETVGTQDILITFRDSSGLFPRPVRSAVLATIHYIHYWTPNEVAAGFALKPRNDLLIAVDVTWSKWSQYMDSQAQIPQKQFRDTYTPRLGLEYVHHTGIAMRAGYSFQPSPVPEQTGSANYLDNDKHVFSIGLGYTFSRSPIPIWKKPLTVDSYFQYQQLVQREYHKESQEPPEKDLSFGGHLISVGIDVVLHF